MALARAGSIALVVLLAPARVSAQEPTLQDLLARATEYVVAFQKQLSGIVAEETYSQDIRNDPSASTYLRHRRLRSDLLLVRTVGADRYVEFRDVFEVDGQGVRDRDERLTKLFLDPPLGAASQLERVAQESARYNIGNFTRTMNTPLLPVSFLLPAYQSRFSLEKGGSSGDVSIVRFRERERPTLIRTPRGEDLISRGRYWITNATGAITRTELVIEQGQFRATVDVNYRLEPTLGFLVPADMRELCVARRERVEGHAEYGRFRRFQVNVDETIKPVKQQ